YEGINIGPENGGVHGLITYMRTDSLRISNEAADAAQAFIKDKYGDQYYPQTRRVYKTKAEAQDAHEAIRPVDVNVTPEMIKKYLTPDQFKLYRLIFNRFIASQMASAELDTVTADIENSGYIFRSSGYTVKFQGYMAVYEEGEDAKPLSPDAEPEPEKTKLPPINEGDMLTRKALTPAQHFTEPPPRFNEATLVKFLEEKGIGRPSTFATIITTIISRGYVTREGKALKPTQLGFITTKIMIESFPDVVDYAFTAKMEDELDDIENGTTHMNDVLHEFYRGFEQDLIKAEANVSKETIEVPVEETDIICEKCGSRMIIKNGRYGKFAACPNYPECKNTKPLDREGKPAEAQTPVMTDMKCELCGSPMLLRTGRYGSFYACSKYPECKGTKRIAKTVGVKCPKCNAEIVAKYGRNRTAFYSCERYPECDFSTWDLPLNENCPNCGKPLYKKKGKPLIICADKDCGYKRPDDRPETVRSAEEDINE
nr:type I DNA topoisomerase [Clostridia bacterium]